MQHRKIISIRFYSQLFISNSHSDKIFDCLKQLFNIDQAFNQCIFRSFVSIIKKLRLFLRNKKNSELKMSLEAYANDVESISILLNESLLISIF